ncbi:MAG: hypothetical protein J6M47_10960, partial [Clostridia bacterium]|nr:hypothetical protein [Clostridia bacterium]
RLYFLLHFQNRSPDVEVWMSCPRLMTPGDGRNIAQGTDLPGRWVEKRRQRHFGILSDDRAQSEQSGCAFAYVFIFNQQKSASPKGGGGVTD